ncbi:hypothetical protein HGA34_04855 [Candidatus Falkowbacteria bacterium]|nr:hypothetical protein [Candidatus Falkowbacteria bacterium]
MKKEGDPRKTKVELFPEPKDRIIFALNTSDFVRAQCLVSLLSSHVGYFKFGPELASAMLASLLCSSDSAAADNMRKVRAIFNEAKDRIFWDGRLAGIASTIGSTTKTLSDMGVCMLSVQAKQGMRSISAASENKGKSLLFAATPRSSVDHEECRANCLVTSKQEVRLIEMIRDKGVDGIICSSHETAAIRACLPEACVATRDVRPLWVPVSNRSKVITPHQAIMAGADAVIIGKPISQPPVSVGDPTRAADRIIEEIKQALLERQKLLELNGGETEAA